jgi:hypothetical protein
MKSPGWRFELRTVMRRGNVSCFQHGAEKLSATFFCVPADVPLLAMLPLDLGGFESGEVLGQQREEEAIGKPTVLAMVSLASPVIHRDADVALGHRVSVVWQMAPIYAVPWLTVRRLRILQRHRQATFRALASSTAFDHLPVAVAAFSDGHEAPVGKRPTLADPRPGEGPAQGFRG